MRYAVLGPGGIGGLIGALLARAGNPVIFILRPGARAGYPDKVRVESTIYGAFEAPITTAETLTEPIDVLLVTCKATHLIRALDSAPPSAVRDALVVPLLNGFDHIAVLRHLYGESAVVPGMIRTESTRVAPGHFVHNGWHIVAGADADALTPSQPIQLASDGPRSGEVEALAVELREAGVGVQLWPENQVVWQKLAIVAPYALATTAVAGSIGVVRAHEDVLDHLRVAAGEAVDVAAAMGVDLDKPKVMDTLERYPDAMRVSMERDLAAGRDLEIANIADPIIREGERRGVSVTSLRWLRDRAVAQAAARKV